MLTSCLTIQLFSMSLMAFLACLLWQLSAVPLHFLDAVITFQGKWGVNYYCIGVGRFRILGGGGGGGGGGGAGGGGGGGGGGGPKFRILGGGGGGARGGQIPSRHMTSKRRRCDVMTSHRRHFDVVCPLGF